MVQMNVLHVVVAIYQTHNKTHGLVVLAARTLCRPTPLAATAPSAECRRTMRISVLGVRLVRFNGMKDDRYVIVVCRERLALVRPWSNVRRVPSAKCHSVSIPVRVLRVAVAYQTHCSRRVLIVSLAPSHCQVTPRVRIVLLAHTPTLTINNHVNFVRSVRHNQSTVAVRVTRVPVAVTRLVWAMLCVTCVRSVNSPLLAMRTRVRIVLMDKYRQLHKRIACRVL
jgi:hypothetical protein